MDVDMHINDLAEFMFLRNVNDAKLALSLGGIEDHKDLFYFCLDLFCKGIVLMYGQGSNKVNIDDITQDQFMLLHKKMLCAGIKVTLDVYEDLPCEAKQEGPSLNIGDIEQEPSFLPLNDYRFILRAINMVYQVTFDIIHMV